MKKRILAVVLVLALCLSLTACKSSDYKNAVILQGSKEYQAAADIFVQLADYKDSATHLAECNAMMDYLHAVELQSSKDYQGAADIFARLGDLEDSAVRLSDCNAMMDYLRAVELQSSKDYQGAADIFTRLGDLEDSADRLAECNEMIEAIANFETVAAELDAKNDALDEAIAEANALIQSEDKALDESLRTSLEALVADANGAKIVVPELPETAEEINKLAEDLSAADYAVFVEEINVGLTPLETSMKQYALVNNPTEEYVIACLEKVPGVMEIAPATEDHDPNGNLNKQGGYTAAVYFSHENVNQGAVYGASVIDKGTDCGGQIEVYTTEENAIKRENYLAAFDGSLIASGSHVVIGTVVVRTSNLMTASQQKELEANIIAALTALE